jgi:hypothetical protein
MIIFPDPRNSAETEPNHNEVKQLIRCDAIIHMRQSCLEFIIESVHFSISLKLTVMLFSVGCLFYASRLFFSSSR